MNRTRNVSKSGIEPTVEVPYEITPEVMELAGQWPERFASKVSITPGCWEWQAGKAYGYGRYAMGRNSGAAPLVQNAHRVSLKFAGIHVPDDLHVDHLCRNHGCVRPDHLEVVYPKVNAERGRAANVAGLCRAGLHEWSGENILTESGGIRRCRPCRDARELEYRPPAGTAHADKTHCPQGHEYDLLNTRFKNDGSRDCRACHKVRERIKYRNFRGLEIREEHYVA